MHFPALLLLAPSLEQRGPHVLRVLAGSVGFTRIVLQGLDPGTHVRRVPTRTVVDPWEVARIRRVDLGPQLFARMVP